MKNTKYRIDMFNDNGRGFYLTDDEKELEKFIKTHDFSNCVAFLLKLIECIDKYEVIKEIK